MKKLFRFVIWYSVGYDTEAYRIVSCGYETEEECLAKMSEEMEDIGHENVLSNNVFSETVPGWVKLKHDNSWFVKDKGGEVPVLS